MTLCKSQTLQFYPQPVASTKAKGIKNSRRKPKKKFPFFLGQQPRVNVEGEFWAKGNAKLIQSFLTDVAENGFLKRAKFTNHKIGDIRVT